MSGPVLFERRDAVAWLTLNRPDFGNAIDVPLARALFEAVAAADEDVGIRCVVIRGNGRLFCAGGDVSQLHAAGEDRSRLLDEILCWLHPAMLRLAEMEKPVVTAVQGPAAGAGLGLAAIGDIALAGSDAHFTMAYSKIGLSPDAGATWLLPRLVGMRRAQELALTNRRLSAAEAAQMGLITRAVPHESLAAEVEATVSALVSSAAGAIGRTKQLLFASGGALRDQLEAERAAIIAQGASEESRIGFAAFSERRAPDFTS
jgi:2-(1,2-epoxy-1,2-dihydrophenyl)acetyl-CoA isomerase